LTLSETVEPSGRPAVNFNLRVSPDSIATITESWYGSLAPSGRTLAVTSCIPGATLIVASNVSDLGSISFLSRPLGVFFEDSRLE